MKISAMNWTQVEAYLKTDDRAIVPLGSTEQHAYLSLSVDSILSERIAVESAEPLGVPVFPVIPFGITPYFMAFPGTISLKTETYLRVITDVLDSLYTTGFRRILFVNGHGGNGPGQSAAIEWLADHAECRVRFHNWWAAPKTMGTVKAIDPVASHASWMENFPCTRLAGVVQPDVQKPMVDMERMRTVGPAGVREILGDGNFGGHYERSDEEMDRVWSAALEETRALITTW